MSNLRRLSVVSRRWYCSLNESYIAAPKTATLLNDTFGIALQKAVEKTPDRTACVFTKQNIRKTYTDLLQDVDKLCVAFRRVMKLQPGDRIGMWGSNTYEWLLTEFATARCGLVMVTLNPLYAAPELEFALKKTGCKALISGKNFRTIEYMPILRSFFPDAEKATLGDLKSSRLPDLKHVAIISEQRELNGAYRFADLMSVEATAADYADIHNLQPKISPHDPVNVQFTSGTTGAPKGATLTHYNILNTTWLGGRRLGIDKYDARILTQLPFYHCFAMIGANCTILTHKGTIVVPDDVYNKDASLEAIPKERCTGVLGTPTMFIDMLNHPRIDEYDLSSVRVAVFGGAPVAASLLLKSFKKLTRSSLIGYGLTETSAGTCITPIDCPEEPNLNTVGMLLENLEAKIIDHKGNTVPIGQSGELCVRGCAVMSHYWDEPQKTKEALTEDGWLKTGDLGVIRADKFIQIVGRKKDMAIRGGENIYPAEIEQALHGHPSVADVHVVGVPDERMGEEVCAFVKLRNVEGQKAPSGEELQKWLSDKLARFKVPRYFLFCTEYPMTGTGKVQKFKLREDAIQKLKLENVKPDLKY